MKLTNKHRNSLLLAAALLWQCNASLAVTADPLTQSQALQSLAPTLKSIEALESSRDPKCHATATRLESLIYGTPLTEAARYHKVELQKALIEAVWDKADAGADGDLDAAEISAALAHFFNLEQDQANNVLRFAGGSVSVTQRDRDHYGAVAYSLRAILAVQQASLLNLDQRPLLTAAAVDELKRQLDLLTLAALQRTDNQAREQNLYEIPAQMLAASWEQLLERPLPAASVAQAQPPRPETSLQLLEQIIQTKLAAYDAYNQVNNQIFSRNLQVYFARMKLPSDPQASLQFRALYTEAMIAFAANLYLTAQQLAADKQFVTEADVSAAMQHMLPHRVNEYEDVIFYPQLARDQQLVIESYDMDSFRDSGLHWRYLGEAINEVRDRVVLTPDPFAAELLTETLAHFGVLLLRVAGQLGAEQELPELASQLIEQAYQQIENTAVLARTAKPSSGKPRGLVSSDSTSDDNSDKNRRYFDDITAAVAVDFQQRSADWLSRLLRSYLKSGDNTGNIVIPPAFGGSGIAAEDINNDGRIDLLLLSGKGNKLYLNTGTAFKDITDSAGLNWLRPQDKLPGEVRQPLIADLDNDGNQDIVITYVDDTHRVYRNNGDLTFSDVTATAKLGGKGLVGGPATTFDVNNDGLLDIYIQYFGDYLQGVLPTLKRRNSNGLPDKLFINKGNFEFVEAPNALGADNPGWGQAVTHTDLNQDGWQDLISGNDFGVNAYYINREGKALVDASASMGTDKPSFTMSLAHADLNRDGYADIYVSNIVTMNKDEKYVAPSADTVMKLNPDKLANMRVVEANDLFMSDTSLGKLQYSLSNDVGRGHSSTGWAWDADFFDVDNDSDDDLYVLNGMNDYYVYSTDNPYYTDPIENKAMVASFPRANQAANVFFINSSGKLHNVSAMSGLDFVSNSRSAAYLDLDNDGDLDVASNDYHGPARVLRNNAERLGNNWLKVKLVGAPEQGVNRDAIGAQLVAFDGDKLYVWRQVSGSEGYMSVHPKVQHFGLQKRTSAHLLIIWPNGKRQKIADLKANTTHVIHYNPS